MDDDVGIYLISSNGEEFYVEAKSMQDAVSVWQEFQRYANHEYLDEDPDSCIHLHDYPVLTAERLVGIKTR